MDKKSSSNLIFKIFTLRRLFLWGNIALLVLVIAAALIDNNRGWKSYQQEFKNLEIAQGKEKLSAAKTDEEKFIAEEILKSAKKMPIEIRQIWAQDINAVDRCITCHLGHDPLSNNSLTTEYDKHPFKSPSNSASLEIHKRHNVEKFGCVVCHGGQGTATEVNDAHGNVAHWETPLLKGTLVQSSCQKCHDNLSELKVNGAVYPSEIIRAKDLVKEHGCIGCHQINGEGGPISVDLQEETSAKPLSRIDFSQSGVPHDAQTLATWIKIHFTRDPSTFVPGDPNAHFNTEPIAPSAMPPYMLPEKDADALTAYILGMNRKGIPPQFLTLRAKEAEPKFSSSVDHGRYIYDKNGCAACHGPEARGGVRNFNSQDDVTPNLRRAVSNSTREKIKEKISEGVAFVAKNNPKGPQPPLYMPSWKSKIKGQDLEDLVTYLLSVKE